MTMIDSITLHFVARKCKQSFTYRETIRRYYEQKSGFNLLHGEGDKVGYVICEEVVKRKRFLQLLSPSAIMSKLPSVFLRQDYICKTSIFFPEMHVTFFSSLRE